MNKNRQSVILIFVLVLLSAGAAIGLRAWLHPPLHLQAATLLPEPYRNLQGYKLTVRENAPVYFESARGRWILLVLGNTNCSDACPEAKALHELANMLKQFEGVDTQYKPVVVFVSLDTRERNPDTLAAYAHAFHIDIAGMTGYPDELNNLRTFFGKENLANPSASIFMIDPQSRYIGSFKSPYNADILYSDMQQLIHQLWRYHVQR